ERFGSTALQAAVESVAESKREASSVSSARGELVRAERFFREALAYRPDHLEARVRHGRGLDDLQRRDEAAGEPRLASARATLRLSIADGASGWLLYIAELFLGRAQDARGDHAASRAAFLRASVL